MSSIVEHDILLKGEDGSWVTPSHYRWYTGCSWGACFGTPSRALCAPWERFARDTLPCVPKAPQSASGCHAALREGHIMSPRGCYAARRSPKRYKGRTAAGTGPPINLPSHYTTLDAAGQRGGRQLGLETPHQSAITLHYTGCSWGHKVPRGPQGPQDGVPKR
jgi:hypothetical protein